MAIKQLSVFVENKPGRLIPMIKALSDAQINIRAMSIADTQDFGILRIICEDEANALGILRDGGYVVTETEVLAVEICDKPGSLAKILDVLAEASVIVEYTYAFLSVKNAGSAYMIFRVDDNNAAEKVLTEAGITVADHSSLF